MRFELSEIGMGVWIEIVMGIGIEMGIMIKCKKLLMRCGEFRGLRCRFNFESKGYNRHLVYSNPCMVCNLQ